MGYIAMGTMTQEGAWPIEQPIVVFETEEEAVAYAKQHYHEDPRQYVVYETVMR